MSLSFMVFGDPIGNTSWKGGFCSGQQTANSSRELRGAGGDADYRLEVFSDSQSCGTRLCQLTGELGIGCCRDVGNGEFLFVPKSIVLSKCNP